MNTMTYTEAKAHLGKLMEQVANDHAPIIITRNRSRSIVLISLDDYRSLEESAFLLGAPTNGFRLLSYSEQLDFDQMELEDLEL